MKKDRKYRVLDVLHTVMERLMDKISFNASDMSGQKIIIDGEYVTEALGDIVENEDLNRCFITVV